MMHLLLLLLLLLWCLTVTAWKRSPRREWVPRKTMTEENDIFLMAQLATVKTIAPKISKPILEQVSKTITQRSGKKHEFLAVSLGE